MAIVPFVLAIVLLPVTVWLTFRGVRWAMKSRGEQAGMRSDRVLVRRDLVGLVATGIAFAYWNGIHLDPLSLLERSLNAVLVTALAALLATLAATVLLVALARRRRRETLRRCGVVFVALSPFLVFVVSYVLLADSAIAFGDGVWASLVSILVANAWLTMMPTTVYYAFRYGFRIGEAPPALLPLVAVGTAIVCLARSTLRVADRGFVDGVPTVVGALIAFGGPITVVVIVTALDVLPALRGRRSAVVAVGGGEPDAGPLGRQEL